MSKQEVQKETSSRPNVELVGRVYEAFKRRDVSEVLSLFESSIRWIFVMSVILTTEFFKT